MAESVAPSAPLPSTAAPGPEPRPISRRTLIYGATAGGAALLVTNVANTLASTRIATDATQARAQTRIDALETEVRHLQAQLALYQDLERIGLDRLIGGALDLYDRLWPPVRKGVALLLEGLRTVEEGLSHFEAGLPSLLGAVQTVHSLFASVEDHVREVEDLISGVLKRVAPIGEAVGDFLAWLVGKIPFGVGASVLQAGDRLGALAGAVPDIIADARLRLLRPLDDDWLATGEGEGLQGRLMKPLRDALITPLRGHLEEVQRLSGDWDETVARPLRAALAERQQIRDKLSKLEQA